MEMTELRSLGRRVAEYEDALLEAAPSDDAVRRAVADHAGGDAKRGASRRRWLQFSAAAAFALAMVVAVVLLRSLPPEPPISFTVGQPPRSGVLHEWVSATETQRIPVRFSDGSRVTLEPEARARVVRVSPRGAELVVESGRAVVDVIPRDESDWRFRTGPFAVTVKGTRFQVSWNAQADEFSLELYAGRVELAGCAFGTGYAIEAGQRVEASCSRRKLVVSPLAGASDSGKREPASEKSSAEGVAPAEATPSIPTSTELDRLLSPAPARVPNLTRQPAAPTPWLELARKGHYRAAYERATATGFDTECERGGAEQVLLLGDTARLSGRPDHARDAYAAVRRRFAGSASAARAAFELGRLDAQSSRDRSAASWFETYLAEQPGGALASAALGRLLEAQVRIGDRTRARATAKSYLESYPSGPHADQAQAVLQD